MLLCVGPEFVATVTMSHGLGHVERTILALVEHSRAVRQLRDFDVPDFDVFDIVDAAYPWEKVDQSERGCGSPRHALLRSQISAICPRPP